MNYLCLDFGLKRLGLAYSKNGFISTLPQLKNDSALFTKLKQLIINHSIDKIYVGLSEKDPVKNSTLLFVSRLKEMLKLPVETVEESVSTIEANSIFLSNLGKKKHYKAKIDSVAAAVILRRVIS